MSKACCFPAVAFTCAATLFNPLFCLAVDEDDAPPAKTSPTTQGAADVATQGIITGKIFDAHTERPVEFAAVVLSSVDGATSRRAATDAKGAFTLENIPFGQYRLTYSYVGGDVQSAPTITIDAQHRAFDAGRLQLDGEEAVKLGRVTVSARKEAFYNSIDRKVYNVGKDIASTTGSTSDLLQNIPSVQVDIEGNVSLRGDESVLILIDGKSSTLMGKNRAAVLEQMPADSIEKIEVITNPSAKYKPDGTAGIINITMKKKHDAGFSSSLRASAGNNGRYNAGLSANYNPGKYNIYGSLNFRQDERTRTATEQRTHLDASSNTMISNYQETTEHAHPLSRIAQVGVDYAFSPQNKIGASVNYNHRDFYRTATQVNLQKNASGAVTRDYLRLRTDPEYEKSLEGAVRFQHAFADEGHELNLELKNEHESEQEDNHYRNVFRTPVQPATYDGTLVINTEDNTEFIAQYAHPLADDAKIELGYENQSIKSDMDFRGSIVDSSGWIWDPARQNRFVHDLKINALYATFGRPFGSFGFLGSLRFEQTNEQTDQRTIHQVDKTDYSRLYPTLHLSYNLDSIQQLQLNYSHRVRRPESEELNPYPEYQDPTNIRAGNPHLKPEQIHSFEAGYQYKSNETSYLATVYYRYLYNGFTEVKRYINSTTLLTTWENLATSRSTGVELGTARRFGERVSLNLSSNIYRNEIDASNLGYQGLKSTIAWDAKLGTTFNLTKALVMQVNANYTAKRLTPQGNRAPTYVANFGFKYALKDRKTSLIFTVSDVFNSLKETTTINTPILQDEITRRRSSRIFYVGFIYNFGKPAKKSKDDLQFDNSL